MLVMVGKLGNGSNAGKLDNGGNHGNAGKPGNDGNTGKVGNVVVMLVKWVMMVMHIVANFPTVNSGTVRSAQKAHKIFPLIKT